MTCQEFLARHLEYTDESLPPEEAARWRDHIASCPSCARYDRVVRRGLTLLRSLPEVEPSEDFFPRLQHRIYNLDDDSPDGSRASGTSAVVSLAIAGVLALLAWSPILRLDQAVMASGERGGVAWTAAPEPAAGGARGERRAAGGEGSWLPAAQVSGVHPGDLDAAFDGLSPFLPAGGDGWWWGAPLPAGLLRPHPQAMDEWTLTPYSPATGPASTFRSIPAVHSAQRPLPAN
jgi:anti-sigma factor RsiW